MRLSDFDYFLPDELIAQYPPEERGSSRLLVLPPNQSSPEDRQFSELPGLLSAGDLLIFNDTRVMKARLHGKKETGGRVEVLIERVTEPRRALAQVRASKSPKINSKILLDDDARVEVIGREGEFFQLRALDRDFHALMDQQGHMPLPPYITRQDEGVDESRYQTVYAEKRGAVAAPTAGLHFSNEMLAELAEKGVNQATVTLHVGAGTFQPVRVDDLDQHVMHREYAEVDRAVCDLITKTKQQDGRVIAVGTTSVRSLESAAQTGVLQPFHGDTRLFIRPGFQFNVVDAMITNFHLPQSTLMMLVSAFSGYERLMGAYRHAVEQRYRFFSYGDAMFLTPGESSSA
ncbi:MAG: tRNA preQ1(34) S-adenosylmethionine ribosyltransferase-isomerase QueA [Candidatus Thiodiazotropha weberae]|uniref:S-adenosylmethionine:tRNA ribosyltransferase-isomerase n=1 Tax=Candidatus Thiodiazotropha endoloripes TaxID=1818881 RepID=A0A1E2UQR5_9GAMM|nr:tRNA preQ1(34) S-adenosylmethionine ribosyltransferase-isomerase QueA [Candidatus Thiodiazotropha endoloripes]MCG7897392.1 tRNA preQ1(34) S-adenosylmethionine ribosyltransferase-isomerase QueA [Candidatus Thiodiazotropha weberae]MCG7903546.1 tRNA preQ1(34) S-adenosylmethionine ribosyltransferase-isomerase QueA [Candidatus Thiodiazotropha weberae]ODB85998.1 tRNA preQ1(34) S-adenosylmethionine ribosyltransferase-isomerase QueA [Candidatus Thiodiazotropha endoloripes]ODB89471.1 tRNA preQ1(34) S